MSREDLVATLRRHLGLPEAMSEREVYDATMKRLDEVDAHDARYSQELAVAASLGRDAPPPRRGAGAKTVLDWAQATGRISASARADWAERWDRDPQGTDAMMRILARVPTTPAPQVRASIYAAGPAQTASGMDVSHLPPRLQAAAAREPDRGKVYRWIENYAGMTDAEVGPASLHLDGEVDLAAKVRRDEGEARAAAIAAENAAIEAANDRHRRAMEAAHAERRNQAIAASRESWKET